MRWFGGCAPGGGTIVPVGARIIWSDPPLWTAGTWPVHQVRTAEQPGSRIAVFGPCSASEEQIAQALVAPGLAREAGTWAGSYTVVRVRAEAGVEILTDAAHACPLYTVSTTGGLVWGSSSRGLSSLTGRQPDAAWISSYLADKHAPVPDRSAWEGVVPVPPGHRLDLAPNGEASLTPWWFPVERRPDEAMTAIRRVLSDGVEARVGKAGSSTDLAGMDSTVLAVLATRYGPITGVTAHPSDAGEDGDLHYARMLTVPGLTRMSFPLEERHLPFSAAADPLPPTDEPAPSTAVWAMFSAQLRMTAATGAVCHLTGDGGDNLFLPPPNHLADLARRRRWVRLARDAQDWARLRRQSPIPLIRAALRGDTNAMARPRAARPPWLLALAVDRPRPGGDADTALVDTVRGVARAARADAQLTDFLGVELHNPYFDGAVLDAVVSMPAWRRFSARRYKPVLVDALGELLPDAHRNRATKGVFAGDFHRGVRANLSHLLDLADGRLVAQGLIDPAPLRATLHAAALGAETVWSTLLPTLAVEAWLETTEDAPEIEWTTPDKEGVQ